MGVFKEHFISGEGSMLFNFSFNVSLQNEALKNLGINLGDLAGDPVDELPSKTPRFRLNLLLAFFRTDSVASSTEDADEVL